MGVQGAAIAVLASRIVECSSLLWLTYRKDSPAAGKLRELFSYDLVFAGKCPQTGFTGRRQ